MKYFWEKFYLNLGKCFKFKERYLNLLHEFTYFPLIVLQYIPSITAKKCPKTYRNEKSRFKFLSWQKKLIVGKDVLKICSKFKGEHPCQSAIPIKLFATLLESHFGMGVPRQICYIYNIFSWEHLWRAALEMFCQQAVLNNFAKWPETDVLF